MGLVYNFPTKTKDGKGTFIAKDTIYKSSGASAKVQSLFVEEVKRLTWTHRLTEKTMNLPASDLVQEIHIFTVDLHSQQVSTEVVKTVDKAIPHRVIFQLQHDGKVRYMAAYKRPNKSSSATSGSVIIPGDYFATPWASVVTTEAQPLPTAHNLEMLYEELLKSLLPISARQGETFHDAENRLTQVERLQRNATALKNKVEREKQYHIQVQHHREIDRIKKELKALKGV